MTRPSTVLMLSRPSDVSAAVADAAAQAGIALRSPRTAVLAKGLTRTRWETSDGRIQYFDDEAIPAAWLEIVGLGAVDSGRLAAALAQALDIRNPAQLLAEAAQAGEAGGLMRAVLARRPQDMDVLAALAVAALPAADPDRRFEAASAIALLGDPSLAAAVRAAMAREADAGVRTAMAQCLAELGP